MNSIMVNFIFWTDVLQFIRPFLTKPNISLKVEMDVINQKIVFAELSNLDESTVQEIATLSKIFLWQSFYVVINKTDKRIRFLPCITCLNTQVVFYI